MGSVGRRRVADQLVIELDHLDVVGGRDALVGAVEALQVLEATRGPARTCRRCRRRRRSGASRWRRSSAPGATTTSGCSSAQRALRWRDSRRRRSPRRRDASENGPQALDLDRTGSRPCARRARRPRRCVSPGSRRKLTSAVGAPGQHVLGLAGVDDGERGRRPQRSRWRSATPSQLRFDQRPRTARGSTAATRFRPLISGASVSKVSRATPRDRERHLLRSRGAPAPALSMPIADVPATTGGIDEWPGRRGRASAAR